MKGRNMIAAKGHTTTQTYLTEKTKKRFHKVNIKDDR